jgi:uncharacterized SAM-binding protein YcdF (DUF218 family)
MFYVASKVVWFFATPSNLLPCLILLGLFLAAWQRTQPFGFGLALWGTVLLLIAGLSPLANWLTLPLEQRFATFRDDGRPVNGIIVLGGSILAADSVVRNQLLVNEAGERAIAIADLARRYPRARIVFAGGGGTLIADQVAEAAGLARFAETLGLDPERITFEDRSRTTRENALYTRDLVEPRPGERWLLVTSAWHMPRAIGCFRQVGFDVTAYPVDFRTRGSSDRWRFFTFSSEGLRRLDQMTKEWVGLLAYRLVGYTPELLPGPR